MNLVFIHGRPATGKLTVARKLVTLTGYELYHNHVAVDEALQLHAFGTPLFIERREQLWRQFFTQAAKKQPPGIVFTFNAENSVQQAFVDWLFGGWAQTATIFSVELTASETVIESRLADGPRHHFKKLTDVNLYRQLRGAGVFQTPVIPRTDLRIDTGKVHPAEVARRIVQHFNLV